MEMCRALSWIIALNLLCTLLYINEKKKKGAAEIMTYPENCDSKRDHLGIADHSRKTCGSDEPFSNRIWDSW